MNEFVAAFFGRRPSATFEGTAREERVYEIACRSWRAAGYRVKNEKFLRPTLGARVERTSGLARRAA